MAEDNKRGMRTLEFHEADAMMLAHALMLHATRAWMANNSRAMERLETYRARFEELIPAAARIFDENVWSEMAMALEHAASFSVDLVPPAGSSGFWHGGRIEVVLEPREDAPQAPLSREGGLPAKSRYQWRFRSDKNDIPAGDPAIAEVFDILSELAPVGCEGKLDDKTEQARGLRW